MEALIVELLVPVFNLERRRLWKLWPSYSSWIYQARITSRCLMLALCFDLSFSFSTTLPLSLAAPSSWTHQSDLTGGACQH